MLAEAQITFVAPDNLGITASAGTVSGTADVSSLFTLGDGVTPLQADTITFDWSDAISTSVATAWNVGVNVTNASEFSFVIDTTIVQSDGTRIIFADSFAGHGAILPLGTTDGIEDLAGTGYVYNGNSSYDATNPSTDIYQITNNGTGSQGRITWVSTDVTSTSVRGFSTASAGTNNFFVGLGNLEFVAVPEPSSAILVALSSLGLLRRKR